MWKIAIIIFLCLVLGCENSQKRAELEAEHNLLDLQHEVEMDQVFSQPQEPPPGFVLDTEPINRLSGLINDQPQIAKEEPKKRIVLTEEQRKKNDMLLDLMLKYRIGISYEQQQRYNKYLFLQEYIKLFPQKSK